MWRPPGDKLTSKYSYVELMSYKANLGRSTRDQKDQAPIMLHVDELEAWRAKKGNIGLYTSVFQYAEPVFAEDAKRLGNLYFDLDGDGAIDDTKKLVAELVKHVPEAAIRLFFTGKKGFHVEVEAFALGLSPSTDLHVIFRYIANRLNAQLELPTLDFAVYDARRMWRLVNSQHQETGFFKKPLALPQLDAGLASITNWAKTLEEWECPPQEFSLEANSWYREFVYELEAEAQQRARGTSSYLDTFMKQGTGRVQERPELEFDPVGLFRNCPATMKLWEKAERTHDLAHEERLFLLSILSYDEEALSYLEAILSNCSDYNPSKSKAHIDDWIRRREHGIGGRPYTCERANAAGVGCGNCQLEARHKWEVVGSKLVMTDELAAPSPVRYAYRKKQDV